MAVVAECHHGRDYCSAGDLAMGRFPIIPLWIILLLFGLAIYAQPTWPDPPPPIKRIQCASEETKKQIHEILMRGLDYALQVRVMNLFDVWLEYHQPGQAERAGKGIEKGIQAYLHARRQFMSWNMPTCPDADR